MQIIFCCKCDESVELENFENTGVTSRPTIIKEKGRIRIWEFHHETASYYLPKGWQSRVLLDNDIEFTCPDCAKLLSEKKRLVKVDKVVELDDEGEFRGVLEMGDQIAFELAGRELVGNVLCSNNEHSSIEVNVNGKLYVLGSEHPYILVKKWTEVQE